MNKFNNFNNSNKYDYRNNDLAGLMAVKSTPFQELNNKFCGLEKGFMQPPKFYFNTPYQHEQHEEQEPEQPEQPEQQEQQENYFNTFNNVNYKMYPQYTKTKKNANTPANSPFLNSQINNMKQTHKFELNKQKNNNKQNKNKNKYYNKNTNKKSFNKNNKFNNKNSLFQPLVCMFKNNFKEYLMNFFEEKIDELLNNLEGDFQSLFTNDETQNNFDLNKLFNNKKDKEVKENRQENKVSDVEDDKNDKETKQNKEDKEVKQNKDDVKNLEAYNSRPFNEPYPLSELQEVEITKTLNNDYVLPEYENIDYYLKKHDLLNNKEKENENKNLNDFYNFVDYPKFDNVKNVEYFVKVIAGGLFENNNVNETQKMSNKETNGNKSSSSSNSSSSVSSYSDMSDNTDSE
jgi:hypothetical protein